MRTTLTVCVIVGLTSLLPGVVLANAAAEPAAPADRGREAELQRRVDDLTREVARLRAENDKLRQSLKQREVRTYVVPQPPPDTRPLLPNGRPVPPNWIPRNNGDLWHYIVPLGEGKADGSAAGHPSGAR